MPSVKRNHSTHVSQMTIKKALKQSNHYPQNSKKQLAITKKLAIFVGATNIPFSVVERPEFCDLMMELNEQYDIPGRKNWVKKLIKSTLN